MNISIRASAGSGKTYALTTEYLRLLWEQYRTADDGEAGGLRPEVLLASTFTRKAAGEIFDRVLSRLAAAALDEETLREMRTAVGDETLTTGACQDLLLQLCRTLNRLSIGTLDSFFQRLCAVHRHEAGLADGTRMTDPKSPRCRVLHREAIWALLAGMPPGDVDALLDDLHGADSAPSPVLTAFDGLLGELLEHAADAPQDAWGRLDIPPRPTSEQIAAVGAALEAAKPGLPDGFWRNAVRDDLARFQAGQWEKFCGAGLASACLDAAPLYRKAPVPAEIRAQYDVLLAAAKNELLPPLQRRTWAIRDLLALFVAEYRTLRQAEGLMLFSEAPRLLASLLGDLETTFRRLDAPIDHVLLDEFQDTSYPQYDILRGFAQRAAVMPRSVFLVGDMKQAIYGWRGGRAEIFELAEREIADMTSESRDISYRSSPVILEAVNALFQGLDACETLSPHRAVSGRWRGFFEAHRAHHSDLPGYVELCASPTAGDGGGHGDACAARIAERVRRMPPGISVGVLVRRNATVSALTDRLRAVGLDVSSEGVGAVADDPAVEIILSALTLADHPGHSAAAFHVAHSPLAALLGVPPDLHARPEQTAAVANTVRRLILSIGYGGVIAQWAAHLNPFGPERTARRLEQLLGLAAEFDRLPPMRAAEFVAAVREAAVENPGAAPVRVMTINRAKGLEFDAVFLPELDWSAGAIRPLCLIRPASLDAMAAGGPAVDAVFSFPREGLRRLDPALTGAHQAHRDEEVTGLLCLLYVAMTRAKKALHLFVGPPGSGVTPGKLLREILGGASATSAGDDWTTLYSHGTADWHGTAEQAPPPDTHLVTRPAPRFRDSGRSRRRLPARGPERDGDPQTAGDIFQTLARP